MMDIKKRRRYDSTLEFDDSIPTAKDIKKEEDFYTLFQKTFTNNSRFAVDLPVPELGDKDTSIEDVRKFYSYWDFFKTWREFCQFDEHDPTKAQSRYEKRWMEGENKKEREIHGKAERKRLVKLAETCYELDPRIQLIL
jgi:DnaJ family protein C protein 2